jgi:cobaltochelatase CobT
MKQHIDAVAVLLDVFARALDQAGVTNEVLGFTTGAWNGGRAQRDWIRAGRPRNRGASTRPATSSSRMRRRRGAGRAGARRLLKNDLFREGIDGEAVEWAARRLDRIEAERRLLLVVSDGSPADSATALANDPHYLDHHLRLVSDRPRRGRPNRAVRRRCRPRPQPVLPAQPRARPRRSDW